jgi:hypothetical protein
VTPPPTPALAGTPATWDMYQVIVPPTVTATSAADHATLDAPSCRITFWPGVPAQQDLSAQALDLLKYYFNDPSRWSGLLGNDARSPLDGASHHTGITAQGFHFEDVSAGLLGLDGRWTGEEVRIQLTDVDGQAAAVVGYQPTELGCVTKPELVGKYEWLYVTYSLSFPGHPGDPKALANQLVGGWFGSDGTVGLGNVFAANGHYSDTATIETYTQTSPTQILDTYSTWLGNGTWAANGDLLTMWTDGKPSETHYFRIYTEVGGSAHYTYLKRLELNGTVPDELSQVKN